MIDKEAIVLLLVASVPTTVEWKCAVLPPHTQWG